MNHMVRTQPLSAPKNKNDGSEDVASSTWLNQERESMHRKMLSAVSHDLKTPLASVIGSLEVMERMKDRLSPEKQKELFAVALQEAYRLDAFVTNILDMAKLETGAVKVQRENADCDVVVRQAISRMGRRLAQSTVEVKPESGKVLFTTDVMLLSRVLNLLLDNAVKYGGKAPIITVSFGEGASGPYIKVRDQGDGIPPDKIDTIFCKYTRISKQDNQIAGTGLGLAICREIMKLLGGSISAANNDGKGCIFTLWMPTASLV
jgi:K+-sensing histidine kinase KdpD